MGLYLYSPLIPVTDRVEVSHRAGWALYWAEEIGAKLITTSQMRGFADRVSPSDFVFVYHGMEFKNVLNFPGGPPPEIYDRAESFRLIGEKVGSNLISMDREMPDYAGLLGNRLDPKRFDQKRLREALSRSGSRRWPTTNPKYLVVGDSHSLSLYTKGSRIHRNDGLTLHGALKKGLANLVEEAACPGLSTITLYFGNIDIRHHLLRHGPDAARDLLSEYRRQVKGLVKSYPKQLIEVAEPLPIENESRKLPKTGWYKGTPFFGSWAERANLRNWWCDQLNKWPTDGIKIYRHPKHFINKEGELDFEVMEKPQSVHIRPSEYRHVRENGSWSSI
jgi:hypothetical protein